MERSTFPISVFRHDIPTSALSGVFRGLLAVPLLQKGEFIGALMARRIEVRPFTAAQIKLLETFASQAVIAIENVRLLQELRESLEAQTATSEILGVIASSPTDIQPVLDSVARNAARLCEATDAQIRLVDGDRTRLVASFGDLPAPLFRSTSLRGPSSRALRNRETVHVHDLLEAAKTEFPDSEVQRRQVGTRTFLSTPMLREGTPIGLINIRRTEVRPFSERHIRLLETFAAQAVIAIENVRLFTELEQRNRDLTEALEQQTATSEILRVIASSPTDIQPVLNVVAENAAKLCDAIDGVILQPEDDHLRILAKYGPIPTASFLPLSRDFPPGRAVIDRETIHIHDLAEVEAEYPSSRVPQQITGVRTVLNTPLLREGVAIGCIGVRRTEVRPFTEKHIALLKTFADQAVIAIENVRLFKELQERNTELREALEHQTATSEVLGIISRSPTDVQPVLDAIVESAARVCGVDDMVLRLYEGNKSISRAHFGPIPIRTVEVDMDLPRFRWMRERGTLHVPDLRAQNEFPVSSEVGWRTHLSVPLRQQKQLIGHLSARRIEVRPFNPAQIKLLETFADQAVIAIENVRLFKELQERNRDLTEALEQQTATSEILRVIASSPTDIQPVLDVVAESAARLCNASDAVISRVDGNLFRIVASYGSIPLIWTVGETYTVTRGTPAGRAMLDRQTIHVHDIAAEIETEFPQSRSLQQVSGARTILATPLLREGIAIGIIVIRRTEVRPFSEKQIALLKTFADQAVIAIENVRLFQELKEALEQRTATSETLGVIASSPTNIQPVLDTIAESAARICGADDAFIRLVDNNLLHVRAHYGQIKPEPGPRPIDRLSVSGRSVLDRQLVHINDLSAVATTEFPETVDVTNREGIRTTLAAPLMREGVAIGCIVIRRTEVRPFTDKQIALLKTFADQAVIAIENVRLFRELEARTRELVQSVGELKALGEVGQAVSSTLDLQTVLSTIVGRAVQLSGTDCGIIYEYDEPTQEFHLRASYQMEVELVKAYQATPLRLGQGATGRAAETKVPTQITDLRQEQEFATRGMRPILSRLGYQSLLAVPLLLNQKIMGALTIYRRQTGSFAPEVMNLLQSFATQSVLAIQNARLFREIEDKSRQIEAANRHKSEFLANMSHELRTPLNAIIGFSEVLQEKLFGELNDKQAEYTEDILTSGRHLLSLINEILDLSKVEAGRMELETAPFDLPLAIDNARIFVRERAAKHGITVDIDVDQRLGEYVGDERKIKQILLNLLSNAVKFTPEGGRIAINARQVDGAVEISVTDTGIGIAPEDQPKIFEEFRQVGSDYSHKVEGTGLGLTLAKKFVELHGGQIWVTSAVGSGSTFSFTLPRSHI